MVFVYYIFCSSYEAYLLKHNKYKIGLDTCWLDLLNIFKRAQPPSWPSPCHGITGLRVTPETHAHALVLH